MKPTFEIRQEFKLRLAPWNNYTLRIEMRPDYGNSADRSVLTEDVLKLMADLTRRIEEFEAHQ